jgi:uncharacterized phage-associated protein
MGKVDDVAALILDRLGEMTAMKLQKLVYYSQVWHLVWEEKPLFEEPIEAWANGPVVPALYDKHRGEFKVSSWRKWGSAENLDGSEIESIDVVLERYGPLPAHTLSELTHQETPWLDARQGLAPGERGNRVISQESMYEFYDSLL